MPKTWTQNLLFIQYSQFLPKEAQNITKYVFTSFPGWNSPINIPPPLQPWQIVINSWTSCIWEHLNSQASSYSGVKVQSKSSLSLWLRLNPQPARGHHFFPLIYSHQHSFGFCLPKSNTELSKELTAHAINDMIAVNFDHEKVLQPLMGFRSRGKCFRIIW